MVGKYWNIVPNSGVLHGVKKKYAIFFLGIHFIGSLANIWSNGKETYLEWLNRRVKYVKPVLSAYIDD